MGVNTAQIWLTTQATYQRTVMTHKKSDDANDYLPVDCDAVRVLERGGAFRDSLHDGNKISSL